MSENISLDSGMISKDPSSIMSKIAWWEKKRLIYSATVALTQIATMLYFPLGTMMFGIENAIVGSVFYLIAANGFYCAGWGVELLLNYYFKKISFSNLFKKYLFAGGIIFSIAYTFFIYAISIG